MSHPRHRLDDRFTSPIRLSIVAALAQVSKAEFRVIRETVEVSDSTLSKQLTQLSDAGYLTISKAAHGRHTRTWLSLTQSPAVDAIADRTGITMTTEGDVDIRPHRKLISGKYVAN